MNRKPRLLWLLLAAALVSNVLVVGLPVWLIYPFRTQSSWSINFAYTLRNISPLFTIVSAVTILFILIKVWYVSSRWKKSLGVFSILISIGGIWFSRQNHFEWMFQPLPNPSYVRSSQVNFLQPEDMVLAVDINGEAVAYPVRLLAYHHLIQDVVGGLPLVATY